MPKPTSHGPLFPGELMAFHRKQRGWTQVGLAMRLHRSLDWVKSVEQGKRPLDSISTLTEVATVLGVPLSALLGQPLGPPPASPDLPDPQRALAELEDVLLHYNGVHGLDDAGDRPARPVAELERAWLAACEASRTAPASISGTLARLPGLLWDAKHAAATAQGEERRRAWLVLAGCYRLAAWTLWEYGEPTLAWVAADRALSAAEQVEDPLAVGAGVRAMQQVLLGHGRHERLLALADTARRVFPGDRAMTRDHLIVWGSIANIAMFAAARAQARGEMARWERAATRITERIGPRDVRVPGYTIDGPGMLQFRQVGALVELYEPKRALTLAERLDDPADTRTYGVDWRAWRRIYTARAHYLRRQDDSALRLLVEAERVAPEIVRYAPREREILRAILRRRRTRVPAEVRALAVRLRVLPA